MLKAMFNAAFFKSQASRFARIKSPVEMVVGTLRMAGGLELPSNDTYAAAAVCAQMGQHLMNPPSVEGWQGGSEWINTGAYMERVNFASRVLNNPNKPGLRTVIERIQAQAGGDTLSAEALVEACLQIVGPLDVLDTTREGLIEYASQLIGGETMQMGAPQAEQTILALLQLVVTTQEYQMV